MVGPLPAACFYALVSGRVQGVGFRYSCYHEARRLGLSGWVRNRADGAVEVWAEGSRENIDLLLSWLRQGPPGARVDQVQYDMHRPTGKYR
ncbi:MAG: acylphosphatase, partial [Treponema sp.]|nr:acylphosphatase [Treponema sp.]